VPGLYRFDGRAMMTAVRATICLFRICLRLRAAGAPVAFTTDPAWLVQMAINRRGGWPDDPSHTRGSAIPVGGKYPHKAEGIRYNHLRNLARSLNTPRLIVRDGELGEWRNLIRQRIPERIYTAE
jgi:hypothetical protein